MFKNFFRGRRNKNNCVIAIIGVLVCIVSIGYAALTANLNVSGSVKTTLGVSFTDVRVFGGSVTPTTAANISADTSVGFNVTLNQTDDYYKLLVDVENKRTIDVMIKSIIQPTVSDNLEFIATYKDGTAINVNDILPARRKATLLIVLKYKDGVTPSTTTEDVTFTINYDVADSSGKQIITDYTLDEFLYITNTLETENYNNGSVQTEMYAFAHDATEQLGANTDYRYIGNVPDNYIIFNDEIWRIIGIFQTNDGNNRLKIMKDTSLGDISKDYTNYKGAADWTYYQLMYFLNPDDIAKNIEDYRPIYTFDGSLVRNQYDKVIYEIGKRPAKVESGLAYDGIVDNWRVSTDALTKVDSVTYYLGGSNSNSTSADNLYTFERGTGVYIYSDVPRFSSWDGKVGLMYLSDYSYTFAKGIDTVCYNNLQNCKSSAGGIPGNSWLYSGKGQWTLSTDLWDDATFGINAAGDISSYNNISVLEVRPVVYLKPEIRLSGWGTSKDPYVIKSN